MFLLLFSSSIVGKSYKKHEYGLKWKRSLKLKYINIVKELKKWKAIAPNEFQAAFSPPSLLYTWLPITFFLRVSSIILNTAFNNSSSLFRNILCFCLLIYFIIWITSNCSLTLNLTVNPCHSRETYNERKVILRHHPILGISSAFANNFIDSSRA